MKLSLYFIFFILVFLSGPLLADEASEWLKIEIDKILKAYENESLSNEDRFLKIEDTINKNFAGAGIAKFVSGQSWQKTSKDIKKKYVKNFKRHLALNIASMMQGYSNQKYELSKTKIDNKNKVSLIDMEIFSDTGSVVVTWRVKKAQDRYFVIDLIVADISLVVTKRSEFNSMLKNVDFSLKEFNNILELQNNESYNKLIN